MAEGTIRTETHYYPREEINAMTTFYNGKRCIVTHGIAQWAHMLDAALETSTVRLKWMLDRHLRQNRHPKYAAEVRENVIPLSPTNHVEMDSHPPFATLVLHEDLVARTLAFEIELQMWRCTEIEAG